MRAAAPRSPPRAAVPRDASARRSSLRSASLTVSSPSISQPDGVPAPRPGPHRSSFADQSVASRAGALRRKEVLTLLSEVSALTQSCLLYTSDAADDLLCVDLGGRRIIKKKKNNKTKRNKRYK